MNTKTEEQIAQQYDAYLDRASWIGKSPSPEVMVFTHDVTNEMVLDIWMEYLAFTEGIATEVYDISIEALIEQMGSVALVNGFCGYLRGALDVYEESELGK